MKALSIRQPWASLIARGIKDVENRTWRTNYRGPILIHASKTCDQSAMRSIKIPCPRGAIVGVAELWLLTDDTEAYSSWHEDGYWGWYFRRASQFRLPIPYSGRLGLFDVPDDIVKHASLLPEQPGGEENT